MPPMDIHVAYTLLEISPLCPVTEAIITRQYRKLAKVTHPDKSTDKAKAHHDFIRLKDAYDILLRNIQKRGTGSTEKGQPQARQQRREDPSTQREGQARPGGRAAPRREFPRDYFRDRSDWWGPSESETEWAECRRRGYYTYQSHTHYQPHPQRPRPSPPPRSAAASNLTPAQLRILDRQPVLPSMIESIRIWSHVVPPETYTRRWTWRDLKEFLMRYAVKKWPKEAVLEIQILQYGHLIDRDCRVGGSGCGGEPAERFEQEGDAEREKRGSEEDGENEPSQEDGESDGGMSDISDMFAE
ncbi:hypothetical protein H2200_009073 [Cladophialophora chaetospira]|uniref:J domain-containing protein n=1 Tax=Cladophialophora chaetospira TaxID=386627 RepID=A0AA39CFC5_9EURO|nr:hypothetical protein H2200_009073 [Cladophialophora chaetospira]